jgi:mono/diheme cytochrome c family protein
VKRWIIAWAIAFPIGFGILFGAGCLAHANFCGGNPSSGITDGRQLFAINCARCHGADATGGTAGPIRGPSLVTGDGATLSVAQLESTIKKGKPFQGMPAFGISFPHLSAAQIEAIALYVQSLRGKT